MANEQEADNVNVTLAHPNAPAGKLLGKSSRAPCAVHRCPSASLAKESRIAIAIPA